MVLQKILWKKLYQSLHYMGYYEEVSSAEVLRACRGVIP